MFSYPAIWRIRDFGYEIGFPVYVLSAPDADGRVRIHYERIGRPMTTLCVFVHVAELMGADE